jgi:hypothetical protein
MFIDAGANNLTLIGEVARRDQKMRSGSASTMSRKISVALPRMLPDDPRGLRGSHVAAHTLAVSCRTRTGPTDLQ